MDDFYEESSLLENLLPALLRLLPTLLIAGLLVGLMVFALRGILPEWQRYQALAAEREQLQAAEEQAALPQSEAELLSDQIVAAQTEVAGAAAPYLEQNQVADVVEHLYLYADESGVEIFSLRTQETALSEHEAYQVDLLRLQVMGSVPRLMSFTMRIRETALPTVILQNLNIQQQDDSAMLTMDMQVYISPYSDGVPLAALPTAAVPTVVNTPTPTPTPTPSPTALPGAETTPLPEGTPPAEGALPGTQTVDDCPGAPPTLFALSEVVVVDFVDTGALNVLAQPRRGSGTEVLALVYDGNVLRLLEGPACGQWEGQAVRYWRVRVGGVTGWVGEATAEDRWLCPSEDRNCASN